MRSILITIGVIQKDPDHLLGVTLHMRALHIREMLHMRAIFRNCFLEQRNCFVLFINN